MLKIALIQTNTPGDQKRALEHIAPLIEQAIKAGAHFIITPEATNLMQKRMELRATLVCREDQDPCILGIRAMARAAQIPILIGSAIVRTHESVSQCVNRALLIGHDGDIAARYDKIHLFDAEITSDQAYRESDGIRPGHQSVLADVCGEKLGISICYDLRFPALYRHLAHKGAKILALGAAFTVPTGQAHWEVLLRARAIECGAFVLAAAQGGLHEDGRMTYGHSMIIAPWGEIIGRLAHDHPDIVLAELDMDSVEKARHALPQLSHDRVFQ